MTARTAAAIASLVVRAGVGRAACSFYEIPVETPIQAKLDVTPFQRVLVAGFLAGGTKNIDPNTETARLLRSQLRTKSGPARHRRRRVVARRRSGQAPRDTAPRRRHRRTNRGSRTRRTSKSTSRSSPTPSSGRSSAQEYQSPLIVTGSVLFTEVIEERHGLAAADVRRPARASTQYQERAASTANLKGYSLTPKFVFIDGRTGAAALLGVVPRGGALSREPEHAGAVVLLRADGQAPAGLPEHAQHAEDPRHADPAEVGRRVRQARRTVVASGAADRRRVLAERRRPVLALRFRHGAGEGVAVRVRCSGSRLDMFAIVEAGGRQEKVEPGRRRRSSIAWRPSRAPK